MDPVDHDHPMGHPILDLHAMEQHHLQQQQLQLQLQLQQQRQRQLEQEQLQQQQQQREQLQREHQLREQQQREQQQREQQQRELQLREQQLREQREMQEREQREREQREREQREREQEQHERQLQELQQQHQEQQQQQEEEEDQMEVQPPTNEMTKLINPQPLSLWRELASARDRGINFDLELRCGLDNSPSIFCHKLILGPCSDFLRDVICLSDQDECVILLPEFDYYTMRHFVNSVYNNFLTYEETSDIYLPQDFVDALGLTKPRIKRVVKVEEEHHVDASKFLQMNVKTEVNDYNYSNDQYDDYDDDEEDEDYKPPLPYPGNGIPPFFDFDWSEIGKVSKKKKSKPYKPRAKKVKTENGEEGEKNTMITCEECDEVFPSLRQHLVHKRKVHMPNEKVFVSCRLCRKESSVRKFPRHLAKFHMTHICDVCGSEHETWAKLYDHKRYTHHTFPCNICDYKCVGRIELERHKANEHGCSFHCEFCGKVFQRRKCLTNHKRYVHTPDKDKKYQCKYCGKGYGGKSHLQSHVSSAHTKDRPFFCRFQCGARFNADCNVVKHERAKHGRSFLDRPKPPVVPMPF